MASPGCVPDGSHDRRKTAFSLQQPAPVIVPAAIETSFSGSPASCLAWRKFLSTVVKCPAGRLKRFQNPGHGDSGCSAGCFGGPQVISALNTDTGKESKMGPVYHHTHCTHCPEVARRLNAGLPSLFGVEKMGATPLPGKTKWFTGDLPTVV
jgi:hypothetical protein